MSTTVPSSSLHSLHSKTISFSQNEILNLSIGDLDWESASESGSLADNDDYDVFDYLHDDDNDSVDYDSDDNSFTGSFRWTDRTKVSDEIPELTRRRQSKDVVDETKENKKDTTKSSTTTKLGGRISSLTSSPTNSPRSTLGEFLQRTTKPLKSAPLANEEAGFVDDLTLDDTIYTVEDEIEFMCVAMEKSTV